VDGNIWVFDQAFLPAELMKDVLFDLLADCPGLLSSLISDQKQSGVLAVAFQESKESASTDLQDVEDIP
jgi:hypothetical protein